MRTHYLHYLKGIKDNYLGRTWQITMNRKYEGQSFRQEGFERESPPAYIVRRIMYTRMLVASDDGGPTEVYLVMQKAPISWGPILNLETVRSTSLLYSRATDHELALVHAAKYESTNVLTSDNLLYTLRKLGISVDRNRPFDRSAKMVTSTNEKGEEVIHEALLSQLSREGCLQEITLDPEIMREAFAVLKKRQRPPPKGGYPYSKNDHVTTKMGRLPPSPCKVCGSPNHWDKECPDWAFYEAKQQKTAYRIETNEEEELEGYYASVYSILVTERLASETKSSSESSDFHKAVPQERINSFHSERKSDNNTPWKRQAVFMEEEEDEFWAEYRQKEKSSSHLLYQVGDEDDESPQKEAFSACTEDAPSSQKPESDKDPPREVKDPPREVKDPPWEKDPLSAPPAKEKPFKIPKARSRPEGMSAIGVSVLSTKGFVGGLNNVETDLRLETGGYHFYD
ncbi:uncharacterized protein LACBIDRAFT_325548 [Laccaria bicolor S238N-H82]|uniref:Predicted protein n=1 Tax=Laccaria bicolor (strain S238N-H82 / ATCC MYA-4686) TaxID=486041 RepID=B0D5F7_LACBS|nr:uncharacterized protein LACBIDRAFT_325548 [Laccaria bicolor S238N-H82]EDR09763.1 predicted protein [Laccaria bicolor S238N-H82]|eukprot:XP_001879148.1 predicted protein [Laccaria bicolor S238N-H82]